MMIQLRNVRRTQSGGRAAATQRKIEALYQSMIEAGMTHEEISTAVN